MPGRRGFSRLEIERAMNQRTTRSRYVEMGFGRRGGLWAGVVAVLSGIVVIVLAVLFSALFLGLFVAIAAVVVVRGWLLGRGKPSRPDVIDAEYTVIESDESPRRRSRP
jgi:hypothetical protein